MDKRTNHGICLNERMGRIVGWDESYFTPKEFSVFAPKLKKNVIYIIFLYVISLQRNKLYINISNF